MYLVVCICRVVVVLLFVVSITLVLLVCLRSWLYRFTTPLLRPPLFTTFNDDLRRVAFFCPNPRGQGSMFRVSSVVLDGPGQFLRFCIPSLSFITLHRPVAVPPNGARCCVIE